jgi:hypothetical protein
VFLVAGLLLLLIAIGVAVIAASREPRWRTVRLVRAAGWALLGLALIVGHYAALVAGCLAFMGVASFAVSAILASRRGNRTVSGQFPAP